MYIRLLIVHVCHIIKGARFGCVIDYVVSLLELLYDVW